MDLTIRLATDADARAIAVLSAIDSQAVPAGPLLLAEVDGELWAAAQVAGHRVVADPFRRSGPIADLLRQRVTQLAAAAGTPTPGRGLARPRRGAVASG